MKTIVAAGHICLDITPVFPANKAYDRVQDILIPGKLIQTEAADVHTGGSVANTGLALKLLGNDVRLLGKVGDDAFGAIVRNILASCGAGGLLTDPGSSTSYSVVLAVPGVDRVFLHNPGANDTFCGADIPDGALAGADLFHFGYPPLMRRMYENGGRELAGLFRRVKSLGIATSLDFAAVDPDTPAGRIDWRAILADVLPYVDFFVPSFEELCFMLDRPLYERLSAQGGDMTRRVRLADHAVPLARTCLAMGCGAVLLKWPGHPALLQGRDRALRHRRGRYVHRRLPHRRAGGQDPGALRGPGGGGGRLLRHRLRRPGRPAPPGRAGGADRRRLGNDVKGGAPCLLR